MHQPYWRNCIRPPVAAALLLICGVTGAAAGAPDSPHAATDGYMNAADLAQALEDLARDRPACTLGRIGASREDRAIHLLTLAAANADADHQPALLITAGLDGRHLVGTETALRVARLLLDEHADALDGMTVYIIPRANPDGAERHFGPVNAGHIGTLAAVDEDRDGAVDEDGPADLNGDGVITQMRRPDPPLDDQATHMADPAEPRLLKKPDAAKGERAVYALSTEGLDRDGDGRIAEDGPGMIDLDHNFMHRWPEFQSDAGVYQLSEPESLALARFVLEHKNIVAAITFGRHDNLVNVPDGKGKDVTGRAPKNLDPDDVAIYRELSKVFKDLTGQERAPKEDIAGSFHAWLYAQRGIPSFATVVWGRPEASKPEAEEGEAAEGEEEAEEPPAAQAPPVDEEAQVHADSIEGSWSGTIEIPEMAEMGGFDLTLTIEQAPDGSVTGVLSSAMFEVTLAGTYEDGSLTLAADLGEEGAATIEMTRQGDTLAGTATGPDGEPTDLTLTRDQPASEEGDEKSQDEDKPADAEAAAWLEYSDRDRDGAGFVEWTPFDHPTLGAVEIGGFVPGFRMNPPADALDDLAQKQTAFVIELMTRRPKLRIEGPAVTKLGTGLYDVRLGVVNEGYLPTAMAMARKARAFQPTVIRLSTPLDDVVAGDRVSREWGIDGSGGRITRHWIIRAADDSEVSIEISNRQLGDMTITFRATGSDEND